jgi:hypothetical protein
MWWVIDLYLLYQKITMKSIVPGSQFRAIASGFKLLSVVILMSKAEPALSEAEGKNLVVCG